MLKKMVQNLTKNVLVSFTCIGIGLNIINIIYHNNMHYVVKDISHGYLIGSSYILKTKRHDSIIIGPLRGSESYLILIIKIYPNFVIA